MRAVWTPSPLTIFGPRVEEIASVLPDAARVRLRFPEATVNTRTGPELAEEMAIDFRNGTTLTVPGYMLWKFRDMIPEQLGDEASGYTDSNPFTTEHGSALMERVRRAHDACYAERRTPFDPVRGRILLAAYIDLQRRVYERTDRQTLAEDVADALLLPMQAVIADNRKAIWQDLASYVREETEQPRLTLGFADAGGGYLKRTKEFGPWPPLAEMPFETFMGELSQKTWSNSPAQMRQTDRLKEVLFNCSQRLVESMMKGLRRAGDPLYKRMASELRRKENVGPAALAKALARTNGEFLAFDMLTLSVRPDLERLSVAAILEREQESFWSGGFEETAEAAGEQEEGADLEHGGGRGGRPTRKRKVFRTVCQLWVWQKEWTPEVSNEPPYASHRAVDFERLRRELEAVFCYGTPVRIRVANDTIDHVTLHYRHDTPLVRCDDFGQALLENSRKSNDAVIGVRQAWQKLHHLPDRDHCPPAALILFIVETDDFEDSVLWMDQSKCLLGMREPTAWWLQERKKDKMGALPASFTAMLAELFNTPYEAQCLLGPGPSDRLPERYRWAQREP